MQVGAQAPPARTVGAADTRAAALSYTKDVAPIMQRSCQSCHRPGTNAPMSLLTYEDVRPWARAIKNKVTARLMPPWHIERNVGIQQFKDDPSLSDAEIATIASWVDAGAPRGNPGDLPPAPTFPDDEAWTIGEPDLIVEIPKPHVVAANGPDLWIDYIADSGMTEDRYLQAVEAKPGPGARAVVHHLLTYLIQDIDEGEVLAGRLDDRPTNNESFLNEFAVGKNGDILPDGTAKLVKAGSKIRFNLHYHPSGTATTDRARVGLKFYPQGLQAQVRPDLAADRQRRTKSSTSRPTPGPATTATTGSRGRRGSPRSRRTCTTAANGCASRRSCRPAAPRRSTACSSTSTGTRSTTTPTR